MRFGRTSRLADDPGSPVALILADGERVLWAGHPKRGLSLDYDDIRLLPLGALIGIGAFLAWRGDIPVSGDPLPTSAIALAAAFAAYLSGGRHLLHAFRRWRTHYAVTDRRIITLRTKPFPQFEWLSPDDIPSLMIRRDADGFGSLIFGPYDRPSKRRAASPRFAFIRDPEGARDALLAIRPDLPVR